MMVIIICFMSASRCLLHGLNSESVMHMLAAVIVSFFLSNLYTIGNFGLHILLVRRETLDWHHSRNDRTVDSGSFAFIHELNKYIGVIEELGENEIGTGIHLFFQEGNISIEMSWRGRMSFWKSCNTNAKIIFMLLANQFNKIKPCKSPHGLRLSRLSKKS